MKDTMKKRILEAMLPLIASYLAVYIAWCITGIIVIVGIALSILYGNWNIFSRSGALIIVCALLLALLDYTSSTKQFFDHVREIFGPKYRQEELERVRQLMHEEMKEYGLKRSEEEIAYLADRKLESYWEGFPGRFGGALKMRAVSSEISLAILGTLISGFGNLLG
jgi:hypothetical protein